MEGCNIPNHKVQGIPKHAGCCIRGQTSIILPLGSRNPAREGERRRKKRQRERKGRKEEEVEGGGERARPREKREMAFQAPQYRSSAPVFMPLEIGAQKHSLSLPTFLSLSLPLHLSLILSFLLLLPLAHSVWVDMGPKWKGMIHTIC